MAYEMDVEKAIAQRKGRTMKAVGVSELQKDISELLHVSQTELVLVMRHGKPWAVIRGCEGASIEDIVERSRADAPVHPRAATAVAAARPVHPPAEPAAKPASKAKPKAKPMSATAKLKTRGPTPGQVKWAQAAKAKKGRK